MTTSPDDDADAQTPITLTVEIDPADFDEPRRLMWEKLVDQYGRRPVAELVAANLGEDLTGQTVQLVNALWDNRHRIDVTEGHDRNPDALTDGSEGER